MPLACDDGNDCTENDHCDGTGGCTATPRAAGGTCDDTQACTGPDVCDGSGVCHAVEICDGLDNDCAGGVPASEADADGDGVRLCAGDCDDANPARWPGAAEICDGLDNDCANGVPPNEADADGDGVRLCAGDCNDTNPFCRQICADGDSDGYCTDLDCNDSNPFVHPGAIERNDGIDNNCPGEPGYGVVDETSGNSTFRSLTVYGWPVQPGASTYQYIFSSSPRFDVGCSGGVTSGTTAPAPVTPAVGEVLFALNRPVSPNVGSWGQVSTGYERTGVCAVESACSNGQDDDADGASDCADPDCAGREGCP